MKHLVWLTVLTLSLTALRPALARGQGGGQLKKILGELNLTDEQRTKIKEVREHHGDSMKDLRGTLKEAHKAMEEAVKIDANKADILSKFESMQSLRAKVAKGRLEMILEVREILTPEQRQKFRTAFQDRRSKRWAEQRGRGENKEEKAED